MFLTRRPVCWLLILILISQLAAPAQDRLPSDQDEPIKLKTDLVTVTASVGANAGPIKSLKIDDFTIYEDGVKQKIAHFAATEEPFTLLLLLDVSGSTRDDIALIKRAARNFLGELRFDDRVGVIVFSGDVEMIAELTDPRAHVSQAIDGIAAAEGDDGHRFTSKTGTSFYDALYLAVEESLLKQQIEGRKAIVCMSDGLDSTSKMKFSDVAPLAEKSDASLYFLELNTENATLQGLLKPKSDPGYVNFSPSQIERYYAENDPESLQRFRPRETLLPDTIREINAGLYKLSRRELRTLGERTGGRVYPVKTLGDLAGVYKQVGDELRSQYSIGYYPSNRSRDRGWRSIKVETRAPGATVRARSGYWSK